MHGSAAKRSILGGKRAEGLPSARVCCIRSNSIKGKTMKSTYYLMMPEELFRLGNATDPQLSKVRARDVDVIEVDGKMMIVANEKGISLFGMTGIRLSPMTGWVWKFPPNTPLPAGLHLVNDKPHHYCIAPVRNMFVDEFKVLLDKLASTAVKFFKKEEKRA